MGPRALHRSPETERGVFTTPECWRTAVGRKKVISSSQSSRLCSIPLRQDDPLSESGYTAHRVPGDRTLKVLALEKFKFTVEVSR